MLKWLRKKVVRRGLFGVLGLLALLLVAAFVFPQQVLCVDSGNVQADALVVLGGGSYDRPTRAAELFRVGAAPRIIVTGAGDAEENKRLLVSKGVPPAAIELEGKSRSTKQNAQFSIPLLRAMNAPDLGATPHPALSPSEAEREVGRLGPATPHATLSPVEAEREAGGPGPVGAKPVIIVTTWYHSRRALHTFQHYAPDIQFYSRPSYYGYPRTQWSREGISGYIHAEYVKLAGYWVCYGVCPF
jgi:uncharacterized SAM-binding protein YcdF (DUF218 family)